MRYAAQAFIVLVIRCKSTVHTIIIQLKGHRNVWNVPRTALVNELHTEKIANVWQEIKVPLTAIVLRVGRGPSKLRISQQTIVHFVPLERFNQALGRWNVNGVLIIHRLHAREVYQ